VPDHLSAVRSDHCSPVLPAAIVLFVDAIKKSTVDVCGAAAPGNRVGALGFDVAARAL